MKPIVIPDTYNYIGAFLTMHCNFACDYCINAFNGDKIYGKEMSGEDWVKGLARIKTRYDLPISLQGGEPTLHKDFYSLIQALGAMINVSGERYFNLDLMTNASFNIYQFTDKISLNVFKRKAPYASIRVSYHPSQQDFADLLYKVKVMQNAGYSIGIWSVDHPSKNMQEAIKIAREKCEAHDIDFRTKEFLGIWEGKKYGKYKYSSAIKGYTKWNVQCKTTELLIGPDGRVFRCHADLYAGIGEIGHILDESFEIKDIYRPCDKYGECNPCDIKIKNNRFQQMGHTSVDIKEI